MTRWGRVAGFFLVGSVLALGGALLLVVRHGIRARDEPTALEVAVARSLRRLAIPRSQRDATNPVGATPETLARARAHFADHCASCHGNDGRGRTAMGRNLYPKAPDMQAPDTQSLSDGEMFSIIENGVRLTGMPAWGSAGPHDATESWELVHFVRHLPKLTAEELADMEELNPKSRKELAEEEEMRRFLAGEAGAPDSPSEHKH